MSISPLRQRMIGDMTARHIWESTQRNYIRCVKSFAAFMGRPPETATAEDLRLYRLHLVEPPARRLQCERVHDRAAVLLWDHARQGRPFEVLVPRL